MNSGTTTQINPQTIEFAEMGMTALQYGALFLGITYLIAGTTLTIREKRAGSSETTRPVEGVSAGMVSGVGLAFLIIFAFLFLLT